MNVEKASSNSILGSYVCWTLFFIFLTLKLTHVIDWSWWWVTAPLWLGFVISLVFLLIFFVVFGIFLNRR